MSNTAMEFCTANPDAGACAQGSFMDQAAASLAVDHQTVHLVNGAKSAEPAPAWLDPAGANYVRLAGLLAAQGLAEAQVQIAWVKQANPVPSTALPAAEADAYLLEAELGTIARALKTRYPNLQQVFFSSRIYAGYATADLNPEPYAYEAGFAVKWLIEAQIRQMASPGQPIDPIAGNLDYGSVAPWIAWGPYLWADGTKAPRSDGLFYACSDLLSEGTHPSNDGIEKVSGLLLDFFLGSDVTAAWFASGSTTTTTLPSCPPLGHGEVGRATDLGQLVVVGVETGVSPNCESSGNPPMKAPVAKPLAFSSVAMVVVPAGTRKPLLSLTPC